MKKPKVEQMDHKPQEDLFAESLDKYQIKTLKPLQKREKELLNYLEILKTMTWETKMPEELENLYTEQGYSIWPTQKVLETELMANKEIQRRILDQPKHYDDRPDQQLYHELYQSIEKIVTREVGTHELNGRSKVGYINTRGEVMGRVAKRMPNSWGEYRQVSDVCSYIVDIILEVQNEYKDLIEP
jgi:hypothetical protein